MAHIYSSRHANRVTLNKVKQNYKFNSEWMKYYEWVAPVEDNKFKAHCTLCNLTLHVSSNGHFSLLQHEKSNRHRKKWIEKNGEYCHDADNCVSGKLALEYPNTAGRNMDGCCVKIERIYDDDSSVEVISPSSPESPPFADKSLVTFSSMYQTNLLNSNVTTNDGNSSLQGPMEKLDQVRNTCEFDEGSRLDLPEINGSSENNSKSTYSDTRRNSTLELSDTITSRAKDPSPNGGQSVSPGHNIDNATVASVPPESNQTIEKLSNYPSIPSPSVEVEQALGNVEMTFEISDNSYPSVPSPSTATEQAYQNAEMIFDIDNNYYTTPSTSTTMEETHQNVEMILENSNDYPITSGLCTAIVPSEQNTELPFEKNGSCPATLNHLLDLNRKHLSSLLDRYSHPSCIDRRFKEKCVPKKSFLQKNKLPVRTSERVHSSIPNKFYLKNELHSIFERMDEAKRVYENKCRIIMDDYKILLTKLSQESDPNFLHNDFLTPEHGSSWNSLKLLKILLSEENSSEENKQYTIGGKHDNGPKFNANCSTNQTRGFSRGHGFSSDRQRRKRGRKRTHEVSQKIFVSENSK